jgi:hypothetical protein
MKEQKWDDTLIMFVESNTWQYKLPEEIGNVEGSRYIAPRTLAMVNSAIKAGVHPELEYETYTSLLGTLTGKAFYAFKNNESPVTFNDLVESEQKSLSRLKDFSNPKDFKSGHIAITVRSLLENHKDLSDELLSKVCLVIPADQGVNLISELEYKKNEKPGTILRRLVDQYPELQKYFKSVLKKDNK